LSLLVINTQNNASKKDFTRPIPPVITTSGQWKTTRVTGIDFTCETFGGVSNAGNGVIINQVLGIKCWVLVDFVPYKNLLQNIKPWLFKIQNSKFKII
jgi:hypothetical protein